MGLFSKEKEAEKPEIKAAPQSAEEMAKGAKEQNRQAMIQGYRGGISACKATIALLEVSSFQGREAVKVANSIGWLQNYLNAAEAELKKIEVTAKLILPI